MYDVHTEAVTRSSALVFLQFAFELCVLFFVTESFNELFLNNLRAAELEKYVRYLWGGRGVQRPGWVGLHSGTQLDI